MESKCEIDSYGTKRYYNSRRELHRENDLPAIEYTSGSKSWYINGRLHRTNGPAVIDIFGIFGSIWYIHGEYCCENVENFNLEEFFKFCQKILQCN